MTRCGFPLAVFAAPTPNLSMHGEVSAQLSGASHHPTGMEDREKDCHLQWNESLGLFPDQLFHPPAEEVGVQLSSLTWEG